MTLTMTQLPAGFGVEVSGIDPRRVGPAEAESLRALLSREHVILVRGPVIEDDELVAFGEIFGRVEQAKVRGPLSSRPEIMVVTNLREDGKLLGALPDGEVEWHFERMHQAAPNKATILHALRATSRGGETRLANTALIYAALPAEIRAAIEGRSALNSHDYAANTSREKRLTADSPTAVHPLVRVLPESGVKALFVAPQMTDRIVDLPEAEGRALLESLFAWFGKAEFVYDHAWAAGDIVVWDNRCIAHARNDFDASEIRLLKRITIADDHA